MTKPSVEVAAKQLAAANAESENTISRIYWFPNDEQIRLVEVDLDSIKSPDDRVHPFYFNTMEGVPYPTGIALIHPEEVGKKALPKDWNVDWDDATLLFDRESVSC